MQLRINATARRRERLEKKCYILELPPELRLMIYEEMIEPGDIDCRNHKRTALLATCKIICDEAKDVCKAKLSALIARYDTEHAEAEQGMRETYKKARRGEVDWSDFYRAERAVSGAALRRPRVQKFVQGELSWLAQATQKRVKVLGLTVRRPEQS